MIKLEDSHLLKNKAYLTLMVIEMSPVHFTGQGSMAFQGVGGSLIFRGFAYIMAPKLLLLFGTTPLRTKGSPSYHLGSRDPLIIVNQMKKKHGKMAGKLG